MPYMLGKLPVRHDARTLQFANYRIGVPMPPASRSWDHGLRSWGAMANDKIGDCTVAAIGHAIQVATINASTLVTPPDSAIIAAYSAVSGYDPATGANDNGADELTVLRYWQQTGVAGHRCTAYAACSTSNLDDVHACVNLFGFAYIGFNVPAHCIPDFQAGRVWDVTAQNSNIIGGHAVIVADYDQSGLTCITWGGLQRMTYAFWRQYVDEAYGVVLPEWIAQNGQSPSGLNLQQLLTDVQQLQAAPDPAPPPAAKTLADYDPPIKGVISSGQYDLNSAALQQYQIDWWTWAEGATVMKPDYQGPARPHLAGSAE